MDGLFFDEEPEAPAQDVGVGATGTTARPALSSGEPPNWRVLAGVALVVGVLAATFALGRAAGPQPEPISAPIDIPTSATETPQAATPIPTAPPPTATPVPTPGVLDLVGEGTMLAEIDFGNRSRAAIWCRETVPGTSIGSTLALLHFADSIRFGEQLISYEELTRPWIPSGNGRRGVVLETEGLGAGNFASPDATEETDEIDDSAGLAGVTDGSRCESCAPERVVLDGNEALVGSCVHGVPLRVGIVYAIMRPTLHGQTPLALHASCGITSIRQQGDGLVIEAEAPLLRGLHEERFPLPPISLERDGPVFRADDLELFDWHCDMERSSHLDGRHLLRTEPIRQISHSTMDTLIGEVGVRGPVAIGLYTDQCSQMTRAWWGRTAEEFEAGEPIAKLLGLDPPPGHADWFYICQLR